MSTERCHQCFRYSLFCKATAKEHSPFIGDCIPFRRSNGAMTFVCNVPPQELPEFVSYCMVKDGEILRKPELPDWASVEDHQDAVDKHRE